MSPAAQGLLQVNPITEELGYTMIKIQEVELINDANTVQHIINPQEMTTMLNQIKNNIDSLDIDNKELLYNVIINIKAKIRSIMPTYNREKRGLINFIGKAQKWLFGTMDEEDRVEILEHLDVNEKNNYNAIENLNKQISINTHFNNTLNTLKFAILNDRNKITNVLNTIKEENHDIKKHTMYIDQMLKLRYLENKIDQIQDNIASAKNNMIHPGILTAEEIEMFKIDFYKLKLIRMGVLKYKDQSLVIALKIPNSYVKTDLKLITPLPNKYNVEVDISNEYIVEINNDILTFKEDTILKNLKSSENCIFKNNCKFRVNNTTKIEIIDDETILVKNAYKEKLIQNCDDRNITLTKNYLLNFYNCQINLYQETFSNNKTRIEVKYFYPSNNFNFNTTIKLVTFEEINNNNNFENLREIKELKFHKNVSYGINMTLLVIVLVIVILMIFKLKNTKTKINIVTKEKNCNRTQESYFSGRGGVICNTTSNVPRSTNRRSSKIF